ncbi:integrase core domain-containing protein [Actinomyces sp.]
MAERGAQARAEQGDQARAEQGDQARAERGEVERETATWVHWYNTRHPHLALGGITPQQAENQHATTRKEAASTSLHKTRDWTHMIGSAAPVTWRCTRYVAIHPLRGDTPEQKGCNAYGSGAAPPITRTNAESARRPPTKSHVYPLLRPRADPPRHAIAGLRAR